MKKFFLLIIIISFSNILLAQIPQQLNYQGVARNSFGNVVANQSIRVRLTIRDLTATGTALYSETRAVTTNLFGLFNVVINSTGATNVTGVFTAIPWTVGAKFLQVEMDPAGGSTFTNMGSSQLNSVPFALNAVSASPSGAAGGVLTGTYPNPTLGSGVVTQSNIAAGVSLPPTGPAGGVLTGTYPNPGIGNGVVTAANIAPGVIPTSLPPSGPAAGVLTGTYPNPGLGNGVVNAANIAAGVIPATLPPSGAAGGSLSGTYPNPSIANGAVTGAMLAPGVIPTALPPNGPAGGVLTGSYPNPSIGNGNVTAAMLAPGVVPTALPPNGAAGGDLSGTYPNPTVARIQGRNVSATAPTNNQVLTWDGTQWIGQDIPTEAIKYTSFKTLVQAWRDSTIDGSAVKVNHLVVPNLTAEDIANSLIAVYFKIPGDVNIFPFPYTSNAGGIANTMGFHPQPGKVILTRFTHNNSGSIGVSSSLQYRVIIIKNKGLLRSTNWSVLPQAWRDSVIDGTAVKVNHLVINDFTHFNATTLNEGYVGAFFRFGFSAFPLPYASFAGGAANTIGFMPQFNAGTGKIFFTRITHDSIANLIGISSSLEYRLVYLKGLTNITATREVQASGNTPSSSVPDRAAATLPNRNNALAPSKTVQ